MTRRRQQRPHRPPRPRRSLLPNLLRRRLLPGITPAQALLLQSRPRHRQAQALVEGATDGSAFPTGHAEQSDPHRSSRHLRWRGGRPRDHLALLKPRGGILFRQAGHRPHAASAAGSGCSGSSTGSAHCRQDRGPSPLQWPGACSRFRSGAAPSRTRSSSGTSTSAPTGVPLDTVAPLLSSASFVAMGTRNTVVVEDGAALPEAMAIVRPLIAEIDDVCSRFR